MNNLRIIYRYEIKKLTHRKLFLVTSFLCMLCIVISVFAGLLGTYYVNGEPVESNYEALRKDLTYQKALHGRAIDRTLLQETVDGYRQLPEDTSHYTLTKEYEAFARPYSDIYNLIRSWTGMDLSTIQDWKADETALYEARASRLESTWKSIPLTETEKEFWRNQESLIDTPLIYYYHEGYDNILNCFLTVGVLMLLFTSVCLSNLFVDEHMRRTDQLVLSSVSGKNSAYWAKILAGVTVSVLAAIAMALLTIGLTLGYYGTDGFGMSFQSYLSSYSYPITIGEACLIAYGVLIVTSVLAAVFVMVISELFSSGIISLAISTALIILGNVVMIPTQYRAIAQIWDWSPMAYLSIWNIFDSRTLTLFGYCFTSWQIVPIIYILLSLAMSLIGRSIYRRYQVSGR